MEDQSYESVVGAGEMGLFLWHVNKQSVGFISMLVGRGFGGWRPHHAGHRLVFGLGQGFVIGQVGRDLGRCAGGVGIFFICGCFDCVYRIDAGWGSDPVGGSGI